LANLKSTDLSLEMFNGILQSDGSGSYPGLELVCFLLGSEGGMLPNALDLKITRYAHDFARRLVRDETLLQEDKDRVLADKFSEDSVKKLLRCLELDLENITKQPTWSRTHFFPYTKSLSHWDSRIRVGKKSTAMIERQYFRGAGAYVFNILRFDKNSERLSLVREHFNQLFYPAKDSPLESLAKTLRSHGAFDSNPVVDEVETKSRVIVDDDIEELYRSGVFNILSHSSLPSVTKIKTIVNWTGIWLVILGNSRLPISLQTNFIFDCGGGNQQLRRASQRSLKEFIKNISSGIDLAITGREITTAQIQKIKGFFTATLASMRLINALKGRRHFTFGLAGIETLALAAVSGDKEMPFESFVNDWLYKRCRFVIGRIAANEAGLLDGLDATIFEENEKRLADQVLAVGMLKVYSDATKMVGVGESND
jgi:hypothetical protein